MDKAQSGPIRTAEVVSWLLSHGINAATNEELSALLGVSQKQMPQRLAPLLKRNEIISPCRGFWLPIPFEYRQWGAPEAIYYIDKMMRFLEMDYYVGWMSAASILGAKHHAVQVFQVATERPIRNRVIGRSDFRFFQRSNVGLLPSFRYKTQTGSANVSTRAATMLSVTNDLRIVAGLENAANIIIELSDTEEPFINEVATCSHLFPISALRRLGWIIENFTDTRGLDVLASISQESDAKISKLSSYKTYSDQIDKRWSLDVNERVEPDV
ncbi:MAG: type IV toxin-antitoxin system AbiEi family antitoxin [Dehalococcoidia bacterium]|nr:type IV toxin-antitoxin system AbiEi family antitoxin [Dehalococcoidia bacterium]